MSQWLSARFGQPFVIDNRPGQRGIVRKYRPYAVRHGGEPISSGKTVPEFITNARVNPGKINMASVGNGSIPHLSGELFKPISPRYRE
jgi:Tripartite tricarboxylate transporter family receptor